MFDSQTFLKYTQFNFRAKFTASGFDTHTTEINLKTFTSIYSNYFATKKQLNAIYKRAERLGWKNLPTVASVTIFFKVCFVMAKNKIHAFKEQTVCRHLNCRVNAVLTLCFSLSGLIVKEIQKLKMFTSGLNEGFDKRSTVR